MAFLVWDVLVSAALVAFYARWPRVVNLTSDSLTSGAACHLCLLATLRILIAAWGCGLVLRRSVKKMKFFYGFFIVSVFLLVPIVLPVLGLQCTCMFAGWEQCSAMQGFMNDGILVSFEPTPDGYVNPSRLASHMQSREPPDGSKPYAHSSEPMYPPPTPKRPMSTLQVHAARRLPKRALGLLNLDPEPHKTQTIQGAKQLQISTPDPEEPIQAATAVDPAEPIQAAMAELGCDRYAHSFMEMNSSQGELEDSEGLGIMWNTSQVLAEDEHDNDTADALDSDDLASSSGYIRDDEATQQRLLRKAAMREAMRRQVQLTVEADICKKLRRSIGLDRPINPMRRSIDQTPRATDLQTGTKQTWLQDVMHKAKKKAKRSPSTSFPRSMTDVRSIKKNSCRCDKENSCHYHRNGGEVTTWCYVAPESLPNCARDKIELMQDQQRKVWSAQLCEQAGCHCKRFGMQPSPDTKLNKSIDALNCSNGECDHMKYGSGCQTWREDDLYAWCFVGWDTTCTDRVREPSSGSTNDLHEYMFESSQACPQAGEIYAEETHQGGRLSDAKEMCNRAVLGFQLFSCLQFTLAFLMVLIVYLFISNHCADDVSFEEGESFDVRDEESEDEDEWQDGSSKKEEPPRRARHSTADSFTAGESFH